MKTTKTSWRNVSINEYFSLKEKLDDESLQPYEKEIIKMAFITGKSEEEILNLNINEFKKLQETGSWMNEFNLNTKPNFKSITLNGKKYNIDTNLQNFTVAQYIDFQTFYPKFKENHKFIGNVLACFIIPDKHKYNEGYDIQELISEIMENLDIMTSQEILYFFQWQSLILTRVLANYCNLMIKRIKNKKTRQTLDEEWNKVKQNILDGYHSLMM